MTFGLEWRQCTLTWSMCEINGCQLSMVMNRRVVFNKFMSIPRLVRAMQRTRFRAKSVKNDLKPTDFLKRNFYFETEGIFVNFLKPSSPVI
jgi:hypothetical protein